MRGIFPQGANENLGDYIDAGLPNITGSIYRMASKGSIGESGALYGDWSRDISIAVASGADYRCVMNFNASRSSAIYGNADTVQPPAITVNFFVQYAQER